MKEFDFDKIIKEKYDNYTVPILPTEAGLAANSVVKILAKKASLLYYGIAAVSIGIVAIVIIPVLLKNKPISNTIKPKIESNKAIQDTVSKEINRLQSNTKTSLDSHRITNSLIIKPNLNIWNNTSKDNAIKTPEKQIINEKNDIYTPQLKNLESVPMQSKLKLALFHLNINHNLISNLKSVPEFDPAPSLSKINYLIGIQYIQSKNHNGKGILLGCNYKHFGFLTGLNHNTFDVVKYENNIQFESKKKKPFRPKGHEHPRHDSVYVVNISEKNAITQIPILLQYEHQLINHFSAIYSIGTSINIVQKQSLRFEKQELPQKPLSTIEIIERTKNKGINTLNVSIGLQYQYQNFMFRISPEIKQHIKNADYFKNSKLSLGFSLLYQFI